MNTLFKTIFSITFVILSSSLCLAQVNEKDLLNDKDFIQMQNEAIEFYTSKEYNDYVENHMDFASKLPKDYEDINEEFETWIASRIDQSKFSSVDEAVREYNFIQKIRSEEEMIFEKRRNLSEKYGRKLVSDVYNQEVTRKIIDIELASK